MSFSAGARASFLLVALLAAVNAAAAQSARPITGTVVDESGGNIVGARVTLADASGRPRQTVITDGRGSFALAPVAPGTYALVIQQRLFETARVAVELVDGATPPTQRVVLKVTGLQERVEVRERQPAVNLALGQPASPLDTPASVSVVSMDTLKAQGGITLQDALRLVPGAQPDFGFSGGQSQVFVLRGFSAQSGTGSSRVLRDGTRLSNYAFVPAFSERIDAVRGPGAAVGVRGEPGGTLNIVTKQPGLTNVAGASFGAGARDAVEASADVNRVLSAQHEVAARATISHSNQDQWRGVPNRLSGVRLGLAKSAGSRYHVRLGFEATR